MLMVTSPSPVSESKIQTASVFKLVLNLKFTLVMRQFRGD